jgi:ATP-dependent DNA helicase PIF1
MEFSKEQQIAFTKYLEGKNVFITGPGGSGKSLLIQKIYQHSASKYKDIHVTALTGCAAVLLNCKAKTLHSWAGIGLGNGSVEQLVAKIKKSKYAKNNWRFTDILIVDEVSMLSLRLFGLLNIIGQAVRNDSRPFGGIQIIFSGDFYQLPPVGSKDVEDSGRFCFESDEWNSMFHKDDQIQLQKIFRQKDEIYSSILNQIREGVIKRKTNDLLLQYVGRHVDPGLVTMPTKLFPTRSKVDQLNLQQMAALGGVEDCVEFVSKHVLDAEMTKVEQRERMHFSDAEIQTELDYLSGNLLCDKVVKLKKGAQVMCVVNIRAEGSGGNIIVCNGSQGLVVGFCEITGCPRVKFNNGLEMVMVRHLWVSERIPGIGVSQVPLILAWALTIHKSQGATLDAAEIDAGSGIFECGQTYVALSRVKSLDGLYLTSFDAKRIRINKKVKEFYESLTTYHESKERNVEVYVPLVFAEQIPVAQEIRHDENPFVDYQYVEVELKPEPYDSS